MGSSTLLSLTLDLNVIVEFDCDEMTCSIIINYAMYVCVGKGHQYCAERALSAALKDWMSELNQPLQPGILHTPLIH